MSDIQNHTYEELEVGQTASYSRTLTEETVEMFAAVSGDVNPVHLDAEYAATTQFGERIAHGAWVGSIVSGALALEMPGPGTIYVNQELAFRAPVKIGDELTVHLEVMEKKDKRMVVISCIVKNQSDKVVAKGPAMVMASDEKLVLPRPEEPAFKRIS